MIEHAHGHHHLREPRFSLLRLSFAARLGGAVVLIAALWASIWWAQ
jgi:hypothetical protein